MEFLDKTMELVEWISLNWEVVTATALAVIAGADKLALVALKTVANMRDAWRDTFKDPQGPWN